MRAKVGRMVAVAAASLIWLAGCDTTTGVKPFNPFNLSVAPADPNAPAAADAPAADALASADPQAPAVAQDSQKPQWPFVDPPATPQLLGADPNDDVSRAKLYFRQGSYGLAERSFRRAVELHPKDAEAWLGLAASYDRLRRFDLADRAYTNVIKLVGATPEIMNNQGFSYMLRGDYAKARNTLLSAQAKDPGNTYIQNNLQLLAQVTKKRRMVN
jgi:tetratricopeptide (TPR) repeat protein